MFARSQYEKYFGAKVLLKNGWNSKQMITEGEAAVPLETTLRAFRNQEKAKQRSIITIVTNLTICTIVIRLDFLKFTCTVKGVHLFSGLIFIVD